MKLKGQLAIVIIVTLVLPLVTWLAVLRIDKTYRQLHERELAREAQNIVTLLPGSDRLQSLAVAHSSGSALYAEPTRYAFTLDGYDDDLNNHRLPARHYPFVPFDAGDSGVTTDDTRSDKFDKFPVRSDADKARVPDRAEGVAVHLSQYGNRLHLFLRVSDDRVLYHRPVEGVVDFDYVLEPPEPSTAEIATGDYVLLFTEDSTGQGQQTWFRVAAPGPVNGVYYGKQRDGIRPVFRALQHRAHWLSSTRGYDLEISIPIPPDGTRFGFSVVDRDSEYEPAHASAGTAVPLDAGATVWKMEAGLVRAIQDLDVPVEQWVSGGTRVRIFDELGRMRYDINKLYEPVEAPGTVNPAESGLIDALLFRFFSWLMSSRQSRSDKPLPFSDYFTLDLSAMQALSGLLHFDNEYDDPVAVQLIPADIGGRRWYLLHETNETLVNAYTSSAFVRLFTIIALVGLVVTAIVLGYAGWLSIRVRRLSRQVRSAVSGDGRLTAPVSASQADDELGVLSRDFKFLVDRSSGYIQYLEALASRLSHELRTPLSVARTSLQNLELADLDDSSKTLVKRADSGLQQLETIIGLMSEATRLEHYAASAERVSFDVDNWLQLATEGYRSIHVGADIRLVESARSCRFVAVPELLQQALDKLISNALDHVSPEGQVGIRADCTDQALTVSVINDGDAPSHEIRQKMFDPLFSTRANHSAASPTEPSVLHLGLGLYIVSIVAAAHDGSAFCRALPGPKFEVGFTLHKPANTVRSVP